jgi:hypothetical protein
MKVFGGSCGMNYADPNCPPQLDAKHLELAVRYALGVPGVTTLNIGVHNVKQLRQNIELVRGYKPLSPDEEPQCTVLGKRLSAEWSTHFGPLVRARQSAVPAPGAKAAQSGLELPHRTSFHFRRQLRHERPVGVAHQSLVEGESRVSAFGHGGAQVTDLPGVADTDGRHPGGQ